jgi:hypothetical protein
VSIAKTILAARTGISAHAECYANAEYCPVFEIMHKLIYTVFRELVTHGSPVNYVAI